MGWIRRNSVDKRFLVGNFRQCYLLEFVDIDHYHNKTKQLKNDIK